MKSKFILLVTILTLMVLSLSSVIASESKTTDGKKYYTFLTGTLSDTCRIIKTGPIVSKSCSLLDDISCAILHFKYITSWQGDRDYPEYNALVSIQFIGFRIVFGQLAVVECNGN